MRREQDQESRVFNDLSALVFNILRSPSPYEVSDHSMAVAPSRRPPQITPAGFASLLLGMSLSLMLCGSVTFFIGFLLLPWVIGFVFFLYVAGIVSSLSILGRAILCHATALVSPQKEISDSAWKLM